MSALAEAIRRGRPRTDVATTSPFGGLRRRHARTIDVVAQSVGAMAPAAVLLVHPSALSSGSGSFAFLDIVVAAVLVVAIAGVVGVFSRRISSTGSLYTYAARGLGPFAGTVAGAALAVGSLSVALSTLFWGSIRIARVVSPAPEFVTPIAIGVTVVASALTALTIAGGLRFSTRVLLVVEAIALLVVLGLSIFALAISGWDLQLLVPEVSSVDPGAIAAGVTLAVIGFVGFESGAALGPEMRRPFAAVPRGVLLSVGAVAIALLLGTAAQLSLVAGDTEAPALGSVLGMQRAVDLLVGLSFLAGALAMTNATTRLVFSLSREGLLPAVVGRTSRRGVPAVAGVSLTVVLAVIAIAVHLGGEGPGSFTAPAIIVGFLLAYTLLCVAAVAFLARLRELTVRSALLAVMPALALVILLVVSVGAMAMEDPHGLLAALAAIAILTAAALLRLRRIPREHRRVGMHDWAVAAQTIDGVIDAREN